MAKSLLKSAWAAGGMLILVLITLTNNCSGSRANDEPPLKRLEIPGMAASLTDNERYRMIAFVVNEYMYYGTDAALSAVRSGRSPTGDFRRFLVRQVLCVSKSRYKTGNVYADGEFEKVCIL